MKENEAIQELESRISPYDTCKADFDANEAIKTAIKALEEVQQYRALEKRLSDMFCSSTSLKIVVDELERNLKEPDSPHPMKARILTYKESADWDAYRAIGTPEECRVAVEKQKPFKPETVGLTIGIGRCKCGAEFLDSKTNYCGNCGQKLNWNRRANDGKTD